MASTLPFPASAATDGDANATDVAWLIGQIAAHYAYLPDRHVDLTKLGAIYGAEARGAGDAHAFLGVLERLLAEFHDHHIEANTNNAASPQLVPTGAEIWASLRSGRALVEEVRPGSSMEKSGVRAGDEIVSIAGMPAAQAVAARAPRCLSVPDPKRMTIRCASPWHA